MTSCKCKMCGGTVEFGSNKSPGICDSCGRHVPASEKVVNSKAVELAEKGWRYLLDRNWFKGKKLFDESLDHDYKYAPAYIGKLCAKLHIQNEENLVNRVGKLLTSYADFNKALQFADDDYYEKLSQYREKVEDKRAAVRLSCRSITWGIRLVASFILISFIILGEVINAQRGELSFGTVALIFCVIAVVQVITAYMHSQKGIDDLAIVSALLNVINLIFVIIFWVRIVTTTVVIDSPTW